MVYVDDMGKRYGRMIMYHMVADTDEELHTMADKIGISRRWFQDKSHIHHYDICRNKKILAVVNGATLVTQRDIIKLKSK